MAYEIHKNGYIFETFGSETHILPQKITGMLPISEDFFRESVNNGSPDWLEAVEVYLDCKASDIESVSQSKDFFGRWTMPGYLDSSDWHAADTEKELLRILDEYYGDEDSE